MLKVALHGGETTGIPLSSLNPVRQRKPSNPRCASIIPTRSCANHSRQDTDGDGKIEAWEKEVYGRIVAADTDHTGTISVRNLFDFIRTMSNEVKEAAKGGIPISSLNPVRQRATSLETHRWSVP